MEKVVTYEDWVEKVITYEDWMEIKASKSNCHPSDASATFTPTILESDKSKSIITDSPETSNEPKRKITPTVLNPFNSTWALVKQYSSFCFPGDSASNAFGVCPLLTKLWQCCDAICETKVRYKNGASDLGYVNNKWGEVMAHLNELCSLICPPETPFFTASAPPSLPGIFGTVMALRLAVTQLVQTAPIVKTKPNIKDVRARFQLVNQLWHLRALPQLGSGCGTLCDAKQSGCRNLLQKHEAVLDALWSLLYSAFIVISTRPETLDAKLGEIQVCSFTVQKKQEGEAFEACWRVCEILKTGVVDSLWSKNGDGNELYSKVYSPSEEAMKPTGPGPNARKFEGQQSGKGKTVNEWSQGVEAARKEMDVEEDEGADHSDNESTHTPSDVSGGKGALDWTMLPTQPVLDSDHEVSVTEPPIASTGDVVAPEEKMTSPKSWDEMVAPPIQEGLVASECNSQDLWQQKVYVAESDATEVKGNPAVNKNQGTSVTQLPVTASASVPRTQPIQVNGGSKSSDADAPGPQKQSEQRPSSLPAKPPSPAAAAPTATPPSTSGTSAKTASNCTRCGNIDAADIEAIHHIRIRILLLHAATARGYSSTNGRKFADFVREMPATSFGDTKAQKKLFNSYRRAVLYSTENIKAKGDTVAHEASVMQVKAAVDWKTQSGKYMFLRELYKHVVGVEIEKMEMLPEKSKATVMTG